jgi:hypothetical protein
MTAQEPMMATVNQMMTPSGHALAVTFWTLPSGLSERVKVLTLGLHLHARRSIWLSGCGATSSVPLMLISGGPPRRGALESWASNQTDLKLSCRQHLSPTVLFQYLE